MDFKKIAEYIPVFIPPLILCSCVRLLAYYGHWDILILTYLSPAELLFLFMQPGIDFIRLVGAYFLFTLAFVGVVTLIVYISEHKKEFIAAFEDFKAKFAAWAPIRMLRSVLVKLKGRLVKKKEIVVDATSEATPDKAPPPKKPETPLSKPLGLLASGLVVSVVAFALIYGMWYDYEVIPTVLLHVILLMVLVGVGLKLVGAPKIKLIIRPNDKQLPTRSNTQYQPIVWFVAVFLTLASASFFYGRYEAHATETEPVPYKLTFSDSIEIVTDSNLIYLGKTDNYFFLFDRGSREARIFPASGVKSIVMKQARN